MTSRRSISQPSLTDTTHNNHPPRRRRAGLTSLPSTRQVDQNDAASNASQSSCCDPSKNCLPISWRCRCRCRRTDSSPPSKLPPTHRKTVHKNIPSQSPCIKRIVTLIKSRPWKITITAFTVFLLFGSSIQHIWCPKEYDILFDVLYVIMFVILETDLILRSVAFPGVYFKWYFRCCDPDALWDPDNSKWTTQWFAIGSFMFWCDLLSTHAILYDITFLNVYGRFSLQSFTFSVSNDLAITTGWSTVDDATPAEFHADSMLHVIGSLVRVARLIRGMEKFSRINWYWTCRYANPMYWARSSTCCGSDKNKMGFIQSGWRNIHMIISKQKREQTKRKEAAVRIQKWWIRQSVLRSGPHRSFRTEDPKSGSLLDAKEGSQTNVASVKKQKSKVGMMMRQQTAQLMAISMMVSFIISLTFTYSEHDKTMIQTMLTLHGQTTNEYESGGDTGMFVSIARDSVVPELYEYTFANGTVGNYSGGFDIPALRETEKIRLLITRNGLTTSGLFSVEKATKLLWISYLLTTICIVLIFFFGATAFSGPVMVVVVTPIERMIRLLTMLMKDPLGYQNSYVFKRFTEEKYEIPNKTGWTKSELEGMETEFLMSTILRISDLMKVGFGSAGVEIIRKSLESGPSEDHLVLNTKGSTVTCIFMFCDIRQFTDATESLQEEVFVFVNKIGGVVHSYVNAYGGSANKNIGDAFLCSWKLGDGVMETGDEGNLREKNYSNSTSLSSRRLRKHIKPLSISDNIMNFISINNNNEADKALLAVVKINIALYHDDYFTEVLSADKRIKLLEKLDGRKGPVVQIGFGLHMGPAVQGAIGTKRKIDPTYISPAVEFAEVLESKTKEYGVKLLISDAFYNLLNPANRRRCRKIDQILLRPEDAFSTQEEDYDRDTFNSKNITNLYTFDIDVDALWNDSPTNKHMRRTSIASRSLKSVLKDISEEDSLPTHIADNNQNRITHPNSAGKITSRKGMLSIGRRSNRPNNLSQSLPNEATTEGYFNVEGRTALSPRRRRLVLPTGSVPYNLGDWTEGDMRTIRRRYVADGLFSQKFHLGLKSYYERDWDHARHCFETVLGGFEDGPSTYFLNQMEKYGGVAPQDFDGYNNW